MTAAASVSKLPINYELFSSENVTFVPACHHSSSVQFICLVSIEGRNSNVKKRIEFSVDVGTVESFKDQLFSSIDVNTASGDTPEGNYLVTIFDSDFGEFVELEAYSQLKSHSNLHLLKKNRQSVFGDSKSSLTSLSSFCPSDSSSYTTERSPPLNCFQIMRICELHLQNIGFNFEKKSDLILKLGIIVGRFIRTKARLEIISSDGQESFLNGNIYGDSSLGCVVRFSSRKLLFVNHDFLCRVCGLLAQINSLVVGNWSCDQKSGEVIFRVAFFVGASGTLPFSSFDFYLKAFIAALDVGFFQLRQLMIYTSSANSDSLLDFLPLNQTTSTTSSSAPTATAASPQSVVSAFDLKPTFSYPLGLFHSKLEKFDIRPEICRRFGFVHGQRVKSTTIGHMTVIGVAADALGIARLWLHPDGFSGAGCMCATELDSLRLQSIGSIVKVTEVGQEPAAPSQEADAIQPVLDKDLLLSFGYPSGLARTCFALFDIRDSICEPFGFLHGDVVIDHDGKIFIAIGVRKYQGISQLFFRPLDARGAGILPECFFKELRKIGKRKLKPAMKSNCDLQCDITALFGSATSSSSSARGLKRSFQTANNDHEENEAEVSQQQQQQQRFRPSTNGITEKSSCVLQ